MRVRPDVPNLRRGSLPDLFERTVLRSQRPDTFRIIHYCLMHDHFHVIAEASNRLALARGMQRLNIRFALGINRVLDRAGPVFADRYHRHDLRSPLETHRAIRYVLLNRQIWLARRSREREMSGIDRCSSGRWFDGWEPAPPPPPDPPAVLPARTWLLRVGWRRWGPIGMADDDLAPARRPDPQAS
jgi:hypothetical protein